MPVSVKRTDNSNTNDIVDRLILNLDHMNITKYSYDPSSFNIANQTNKNEKFPFIVSGTAMDISYMDKSENKNGK